MLDGQGGEYVPLGRLLAGLVAVFFLITLIQQARRRQPPPDAIAACTTGGLGSDLNLLLDAAGASDGSASGTPAAALGQFARDVLCDPRRFTNAMSLAVPIAVLLLVPLSAVLMQFAFREQMPRFRDNWLYGLEAHAALFLLLIALLVASLPGIGLLGFLASVAGLVYATWNVWAGVERAYGVGRGVAARRTIAVGVGYAVALAVVATALVLGLFGRR